MFYSSVEDVIKFTGASYDKLGLSGQEELESFIEKGLEYVTSLINSNRGRDLYRDLSFGDREIIAYAEEEWAGNNIILETDTKELPKGAIVSAVNKIIPSDIGIIASKIINEDLSSAKILEIYLKSYIEMEYEDINILLYKENKVIKLLKCPKLNENEWRLCKFFLGRNVTLSEIDKIAISVYRNPVNLWVGDVYKLVMPKAIDEIAMRACANLINLAYINRESPVITIDNMMAKLPPDKILTDSLKDELNQFPKKLNISLGRVVGKIDNISELPLVDSGEDL